MAGWRITAWPTARATTRCITPSCGRTRSGAAKRNTAPIFSHRPIRRGAPLHSAYPGGATSIGAVTATLLKAFFDESRIIPDPVQPDPLDPTRLVPYSGPELTVGGELNKLAVNFGFGRNWSGIHWRSDAAGSMALGEAVAIGLLRDERTTLREPFDGFSFTRFDGTRVTI
jgi:hypothetical protein